MAEWLETLFGNGMLATYGDAILATVKITFFSTALAYLFGIPLGVLLYITAPEGIAPQKIVNAVLGFIINILRSVPFIILLILTQPIARAIVGTSLKDNAFIVYLVIASTPFVARMIESSLKEVDRGVIEAAQSMGSNTLQIITKVLLPEAKPSLLIGAAIAITTILGYTPMTYLIGGGGLGNLAVIYGIYRFDDAIKYISSLLLILFVQIMQIVLTRIAKRTDHRINQ